MFRKQKKNKLIVTTMYQIKTKRQDVVLRYFKSIKTGIQIRKEIILTLFTDMVVYIVSPKESTKKKPTRK